MYKKIVLLAIVLISAMSFAQETQKTAHLNYSEVIYAMPELKQVQDSLKKVGEIYQAELVALEDDYNKKFADLVENQDKLSEAMKIHKNKELNQLRENSANYSQMAQQRLEEMQQTLMAPVIEKLKKAINEVGKENNFLFVVDSSVLHYISPAMVDATSLVKKKLGI